MEEDREKFKGAAKPAPELGRDEGDDVEGHAFKAAKPAPELGREDDDDDVEGHAFKAAKP